MLCGLVSLQVGEHMYVPGWLCTPTPQRQKLLYLGPSQTLLYVSLHLVLHLYPLPYL